MVLMVQIFKLLIINLAITSSSTWRRQCDRGYRLYERKFLYKCCKETLCSKGFIVGECKVDRGNEICKRNSSSIPEGTVTYSDMEEISTTMEKSRGFQYTNKIPSTTEKSNDSQYSDASTAATTTQLIILLPMICICVSST